MYVWNVKDFIQPDMFIPGGTGVFIKDLETTEEEAQADSRLIEVELFCGDNGIL